VEKFVFIVFSFHLCRNIPTGGKWMFGRLPLNTQSVLRTNTALNEYYSNSISYKLVYSLMTHEVSFFWSVTRQLAIDFHGTFVTMQVNCNRQLWAYQHYSKYLLCSTEEINTYSFGTTWGLVNDDKMFILGWTIPLTCWYYLRKGVIISRHSKTIAMLESYGNNMMG